MTSMDLASASMAVPAPSRAAQYVRMSTEHQEASALPLPPSAFTVL